MFSGPGAPVTCEKYLNNLQRARNNAAKQTEEVATHITATSPPTSNTFGRKMRGVSRDGA